MAAGSSEAASASREFSEDDLGDLFEALHKVSTKYKFFGLKIGLKMPQISEIEANHSKSADCLLEILFARLKLEPVLTCADIVKALRSQHVGEDILATEFQKQFESKGQKESSKKNGVEIGSQSHAPLRMSEIESESVIRADESKSDESENIQKAEKSAETERQVHEKDEPKSKKANEITCEKGKSTRMEYSYEPKAHSSSTDYSSPECDMTKNQYKGEMKELVNIFERFFGKLCCAVFDPKDVAAELQSVGLISKSMMREMMLSPESKQAKIITLVDGLDKMIKSCPDCLFMIIEVMLENEALQETAREILRETGTQCLVCALYFVLGSKPVPCR